MANSSKPGAPGQPKNRPPTSNTGVVDIKIRYSLDYLRYSVPFDALERALPNFEIFKPTDEQISSLRFYDTAVKLGAGRIDWHSQKPAQKALVTLDGQSLQAARAAGVDMLALLAHAEFEGNITRLDFAADYFGEEIGPLGLPAAAQAYDAWLAGFLVTPAETCYLGGGSNRKGESGGQTVYIGARTSERFVRVYEKGKKEGVDTPWIRIELELKGEHARRAAHWMAVNGDIIGTGKAVMREFLECPQIPWLHETLKPGGEEIYLEPVKKTESDRQRWYTEQIFKAILSDLIGGDVHHSMWLRFGLQGLLDASDEYGRDGGIEVSLRSQSRKVKKGLQVLRGVIGGGLHELAFLLQGEEKICAVLANMGYSWDTKKQDWVRF